MGFQFTLRHFWFYHFHLKEPLFNRKMQTKEEFYCLLTVKQILSRRAHPSSSTSSQCGFAESSLVLNSSHQPYLKVEFVFSDILIKACDYSNFGFILDNTFLTLAILVLKSEFRETFSVTKFPWVFYPLLVAQRIICHTIICTEFEWLNSLCQFSL